jgi:hypothetical protein
MRVFIANIGDKFSELHSDGLRFATLPLLCLPFDAGLKRGEDTWISDESGDGCDIPALSGVTAPAVEEEVECVKIVRLMVGTVADLF